ncbi:unnamed protein product [Clonostachys rhizophaga]|uniref:Uncharacterized protein n=1 Tax=Clonostachys rhizophaga TaxID=160324 RepID=A0A9N9V804_9HYPO|nr:unnamed protein product [Clonostachys rhizophaga]
MLESFREKDADNITTMKDDYRFPYPALRIVEAVSGYDAPIPTTNTSSTERVPILPLKLGESSLKCPVQNYHDFFGLDNVECFFLVDHHGYDHTIEEEKVPVLWYKWTGESLVRINQELPSKIQRKLRKWPFTWEGRKFRRPKRPDGECELVTHRRLLMSKLLLGIPIFDEDIKFLREHPEHAQWLKDHMERQLWAKVELYCDIPGESEQ